MLLTRLCPTPQGLLTGAARRWRFGAPCTQGLAHLATFVGHYQSTERLLKANKMDTNSQSPESLKTATASRSPELPSNHTQFGAFRRICKGFWRSWSAWPAVVLVVLLLVMFGWWHFHSESFVFGLEYLQGERLLVWPYRTSVGAAPAGERREIPFSIRNLTDHPVNIVGNRSTCSCLMTTTEHFPVTIPAGQSLELAVIVTFGQEPGKFNHTLTIYTDCPNRTQLDFFITGDALRAELPQGP